ncbi:ABC transporter ATP-binding protein [Roseicitreum antarcticum]|uniref:ATP-binding cassette, subfamily B, MsbA n=1 Tax=Roseicitreum antarcticum TaxID=564137 RepID=A0A1H2QXX6_9RHOB|nr:ABC transporter ATP-binding protein [Roseicitreum antarcticum]SDW11788.1 ATP-binding cassette, subfamily B, MsbA [Roseicitreum antarcticum]
MTDTPPPHTQAPSKSLRAAADKEVGRWLWDGFVRRRLWLIGIAMALMAVEGSMLGAFSYLVRPMFDEVLVAGRADMVYVVAFGVAAVFVVRAVTRLIHRAIMAYTSETVIAEVQTTLLSHLMRLDQGFYQRHSPGNLIERVRGDTMAIGAVFTRLVPGVAREGVSVVALLAVAIYTDWLWTLIALLGIPLMILPMTALQRIVRRKSTTARQTAADSSNRLDEIFHGIATVQLTGSEAREAGRYRSIMARYVSAAIRAIIGQSAISSVIDLVAAIGFAAVLIYGGMQIIDGERTVGQFMSFFTAIGLIFDPLRKLGDITGLWQATLASLERLYALLAIKPTIVNPESPAVAPPARAHAEVSMHDVFFAYDEDPVLRGISLTAKVGTTTAIVGPSGAGKTTVFTLLTRLADPQSGGVMIGGQDIRGMDLHSLRGLFSVVSQDTALFDETIRDNVLMGAEGVSEERLHAALADAHVTEFLDSLPQGLDTRAGPRGSSLSGGQRQRVAIARALLRDAPILLLDEATSALDAKSESLVQAALDRLSAGRTTFVIAHRLATVRRADQILVMERGQIIETGNHDALMTQNGAYARLHALQFNTPGQKP